MNIFFSGLFYIKIIYCERLTVRSRFAYLRLEHKWIQSIFSFVNYGNFYDLWFKNCLLGNLNNFFILFLQEKTLLIEKYKEKLCPLI